MNCITKFTAIIALFLTISCSKDENIPIENSKDSSTTISISLSEDDATRAFFDDSAASEPWEKELNIVTAFFLFYSQDDVENPIFIRKDFTEQEIAQKSALITIDEAKEGDALYAQIVANVEYSGDIEDISDVRPLMNEVGIDEYNGTFAQVAYDSKREDGFVLSGDSFVPIEGDETQINIELKRGVAKVAIRSSISDNFNNPDYYSGSIRVDSISIYNPLGFYETEKYYHTQASHYSNGFYDNLFYLQQSNTSKFTICATYDKDGNFSTTEDSQQLRYPFTIDTPEVLPNEYYRINAKICGLNREDTELSFKVIDWDKKEDQSTDIG
ncbi:MAG: hypothetical protein R3Y50_10210 [Rikenellaceae bacterium]